MTPQISAGFAARCAAGSRTPPAGGRAPAGAGRRNIFPRAAAQFGIPLPPGACVRVAGISGAGQLVCAAIIFRYMKIGTPKKLIDLALMFIVVHSA